MTEDGPVVPGLFDHGNRIATTTTQKPQGVCVHNGNYYDEGDSIETQNPCEHCYCMKGDIVCAVDPCMGAMQGDSENCVAQPPPEGECCPVEYKCGKCSLFVSLFVLGFFFSV